MFQTVLYASASVSEHCSGLSWTMSVFWQGPAVVADKLSYFIRTGQMVRLFQAQGFSIDYVQLAKFSPLPGVPAPAPAEEAAVASSEAGPYFFPSRVLYVHKT